MRSVSYACMNKNCGWEKESLALLDGITCPKCRGIVHTEVRQKSEEDIQAQEKAKEKLFNLFRDYHIEHIDHNVRDDIYSISLVNKEKKKEE